MMMVQLIAQTLTGAITLACERDIVYLKCTGRRGLVLTERFECEDELISVWARLGSHV